MLGICAAVKATTCEPGSCRKTVLKLWKSRPAAPMMRTRVGTRASPAEDRPAMICAAFPGSQTNVLQWRMRVVGVILAAGAGRRIGGPKALLPIGDGTFLGRCATLLARPGVATVVAVLGHDGARVK